MNPDFNEDKNVCLGLARSLSPYKTGNLRFNAIQSYITTNGFVINYSLADAYYIYFLEEGTRHSTKHKGFIGTKTVLMVADYLYAKYNMKDVTDFQIESMYGSSDEDSYKGKEYLMPREVANLQSRLMGINTISNEFDWKHNTQNDLTQEMFNNRYK